MHTQRQGSEQRKAGRSPRQPVALKERLSKRLSAYALAASDAKPISVGVVTAAGVGMGLFMGADIALADIIYTPTFSSIQLTKSGSSRVYGSLGSLRIDVNGDGQKDFILRQGSHRNPDLLAGSLRVAGANGSDAVMISSRGWARALTKGSAIGAGGRFAPGSLRMATYLDRFDYGHSYPFFKASGPWFSVADRYLGLEFQLGGATHFGWAEVSTFFEGPGPGLPLRSTVLEGYAYDTVAGQEILAGQTSATPEPGTLGLLALGSLGLGFWRRKKPVHASGDGLSAT